MRVPAWPIPIHHTKVRMSKPQPTGWLTPQMPTPTSTSFPIVAVSSIMPMQEMPKPISQPTGVLFRRTIVEMWSVIEA